MAAGALAALRDLTPPLTTVALPLEDLGERVPELAMLPERAARARIERVRGHVVLRASTARHSDGS
ncbi:hypothetical protein GCM10027598_67690 [Amycolatopsis oliviviridis]|uniref:Uncharacterized protein n=1 Tax=Amycolatopsis oliviviridis TaxID=1471590 RepID=A0ABQ3M2A0_9PSEU|nr:hypothetical protein GCM10017790_63040 [Amycolatopsis oliviviridis]